MNVICNVITRFYREEFIERVSSIYGLERLLHAKANIYALINLHSKLHEICVIMDDEPEIAEKAQEYFFDLLEQIQAAGEAGRVTQAWIDEEKKYVPQLAAKDGYILK